MLERRKGKESHHHGNTQHTQGKANERIEIGMNWMFRGRGEREKGGKSGVKINMQIYSFNQNLNMLEEVVINHFNHVLFSSYVSFLSLLSILLTLAKQNTEQKRERDENRKNNSTKKKNPHDSYFHEAASASSVK